HRLGSNTRRGLGAGLDRRTICEAAGGSAVTHASDFPGDWPLDQEDERKRQAAEILRSMEMQHPVDRLRQVNGGEPPVDGIPPPNGPEDYGLSANAAGETPSAPVQPLQWLDMSAWDRKPVPQRKWSIKDRVPLKQAGLFSGEGGTGKSIIEL